jgi:hypothetical protein
VSAAFCKSAWPGVVLEAAAILVRLTDRELGHRPCGGLALDARKLRADEGSVETNFFGRGTRRIAVVTVLGRFRSGVGLECAQRLLGRLGGFPFLTLFAFVMGHQYALRRRVLFHRFENLVVSRFDRRLLLA